MAIGEAGSLDANTTVSNAPITVTLTEPLTDPVIVLSGTSNGGDPYALRVLSTTTDTNGDVTSFTFTIEEWEYLDGPHPAVETINWMALEEGVHTLPGGRVIEAGKTDAGDAGASVSFAGNFGTTPPVVLTSVMSNNDTTTVDSDPDNVTATGFDIELQEEEAEADNHGTETIGWIAIQPGGDANSGTANTVGGVNHNVDTVGLGDTFTDAVVLVETQTINGGNTATTAISSQTNSTVGVFIREEQSQDSETNHINESVGIVAFEEGLILCFTPGTLIDTPDGRVDVAALEPGDLVLTSDDGPQPVRFVASSHLTSTQLAADPTLRPITLRAGALGPGVPDRDLTVSPQHRMLLGGWQAQLNFGLDEVLAPARGLVNDTHVRIDHDLTEVEYIHLCFDRHQIVTANGAPSESLHPGTLNKSTMADAAREELFALFPDLRTSPRAWGPTVRPALPVHMTRVLREPRGVSGQTGQIPLNRPHAEDPYHPLPGRG